MKPPDPDIRRAAPLERAAHQPDNNEKVITLPSEKVNKKVFTTLPEQIRLCRPVAVADLARQAFDALRVQFETGREFASRKGGK